MRFCKTINGALFFLLFLALPVSVAAYGKTLHVRQTLPRVCLILDKGGKDDRSFNQQAYEAFLKAKENSIASPESKFVTVQDDSQTVQFIREFSKGECSLVIAMGFNNADMVGKLAPQFPKQHYVVVDSPIKAPNVKSMMFKDYEGSFLVGALAAIKSKTQAIGFVGGMQIPLIKKFADGYSAGARFIKPHIKVTETYVGLTPAAWNNPTKANELATSLYNQGNDIIFVAAGSSSKGVFEAVKEKNKRSASAHSYVIGIDTDQSSMAPGFVLTSMVKNVGLFVYKAMVDNANGEFKNGVFIYGLADNGVDWVYNSKNKALLSQHEVNKILQIKQEIISGKIDTNQ